MKWNQAALSDIFKALQTDPDRGMTGEKAAEVQSIKGLNQFDEERKETVFKKIIYH